MSDWIGLAVIVLLAVGAFFGLAQLGKPRPPMSNEEFEERVAEARGTTRAGAFAGFHALQKLLNPKAAEAVEVLRDMKAGHYDKKQEQGDGDEPGADEAEEQGSQEETQQKTGGEKIDA